MMSNNAEPQKEIFDLNKYYFEYEMFIISDYNRKFEGHLINKKYIDEFKKNIGYDKLYKYIKEKYYK